MEYAKDADIAIHECFVAVPDLVTKMRFTPEQALLVGTQVHTAPEAFGKVMSGIKPRIAVAYHFFKDFDTTPGVNDRIRTTYDGPLSLAEDFMVWNITKDNITVRMAAVEEATWAPPWLARLRLPVEMLTGRNSVRVPVFQLRLCSIRILSSVDDGAMSIQHSPAFTKRQAKHSDVSLFIRRTWKTKTIESYSAPTEATLVIVVSNSGYWPSG